MTTHTRGKHRGHNVFHPAFGRLWASVVVGLSLCVVTMACGSPQTPTDEQAPSSTTGIADTGKSATWKRLEQALRDEFRKTCGCHDGEGPQKLSSALKIYDLSDDDWYKALSDAQLDAMLGRVRSKASEETLKQAQEFVALERERRKH